MLVYVAVNMVNGMQYVGATINPSIHRRRSTHKSRALRENKQSHVPFHKAIRKYGWDRFVWHTVEKCRDREDLHEAERRWIRALGTMCRQVGYNRTEGGGGVTRLEFTAEHRRKLSLAGKGRKPSLYTRRKRSQALKGRKPSAACMKVLVGRKLSAETKKKIGDARRGRPHPFSKEHKEKVADANRARAAMGIGCKIPLSAKGSIKERRRLGHSYAAIGREYDVCAASMFRYCRKHGLRDG